jgi:hypothetical protein
MSDFESNNKAPCGIGGAIPAADGPFSTRQVLLYFGLMSLLVNVVNPG